MDSVRLKEFRAALALKHTPHLGPRTWARLLAAYGSAAGAYDASARWRMDELVSARVERAFRSGAYKDGARAEFEAATACACSLVLWTDPDYPRRLRQLSDPPLFLYCLGRKSLLNGPSVAVVGSRSCTGRGLAMASRICSGLAEAGITVVSGMAWGIDRQAHLAGLSGAGSSIAVLGTGLDRVYPPENTDLFAQLRESGLVVTEFPPGTTPEAHNFPYRNRIVSGLALGVVVVEAAMKSGSRITARLGLEQDREVYAVQGPEGSPSFEGCNDLLEQGARAVSSAGEVILDLAALIKADAAEMATAERAVVQQPLPREPRQTTAAETKPGASAPEASADTPSRAKSATTSSSPVAREVSFEEPKAAPSQASTLSSGVAVTPSVDAPLAPVAPDEQAVLEALTTGGQVHIDELTRTLGWDQARTGRTLTLMEVSGSVRQWPGMRYSLR